MATVSERLGSDYWKLLGAAALSNAADGIRLVAFPWLAATLTRNPVVVAGVAAAAQLPWLVATVHAGVLIDRLDRRALVVGAQVVHLVVGLALGLLGVVGGISVTLLMALAVLSGCAEMVTDTTVQTLLPAVVPRERVVRASGYLVGAEISTQTLVGRPLGGLLVGVSVVVAFFTQSVLALCTMVALLAIPAGRLRRPRPAARAPGSITRELLDGLRWLWAHHLLRDVGVIVAVSNIVYGACLAIFVLYAQEILGVGALGFGIIGASMAAGGVLGSVVAAPVTSRLGERGAFLAVIGVTATAFAVIGLSSQAVVVAAMQALIAGGFTVWEVVWGGMRIRYVPDQLLGRVTSLLRWLEMGPFPLASLLGGGLVAAGTALGDRTLGLRLPYLLTAAVFVLLGVALVPLTSPRRLRAAQAGLGSRPPAAGIERP